MSIAAEIVAIARAEIGVTEEPRNSNRGKRVDEYKAATWLDPKQAWAWCAAFVCWVLRQSGMKETKTFKLPRTAGAWDYINWSLAQDKTTTTLRNPKAKDIRPGDIIVFTFPHIGIAVTESDAAGNFQVVEGNTNGAGGREGDGVYLKWRSISKVKARIRINA